MTSYEFADLALSAFANQSSSYAIFLTMVTAYLVTAYAIGDKLTRIQIWMLTSLYLIACAIVIWAILSFGIYADKLTQFAYPEVEIGLFSSRSSMQFIVAFVNLLTVAVSLMFMWNVRQPKR